VERRTFLKLAGITVTGSAIGAGALATANATAQRRSTAVTAPVEPVNAVPTVSQRLSIPAAGTYRITGSVRMVAPTVEIGGISNSKQISRAQVAGGRAPLASFSSMEYFPQAGLTSAITVRGGQFEALAATPIDLE
jgi:hypothetical protein